MTDKKIDSDKDLNRYRGIAVDKADDDKVDGFLTNQETKMLNNNPRSSEINRNK